MISCQANNAYQHQTLQQIFEIRFPWSRWRETPRPLVHPSWQNTVVENSLNAFEHHFLEVVLTVSENDSCWRRRRMRCGKHMTERVEPVEMSVERPTPPACRATLLSRVEALRMILGRACPKCNIGRDSRVQISASGSWGKHTDRCMTQSVSCTSQHTTLPNSSSNPFWSDAGGMLTNRCPKHNYVYLISGHVVGSNSTSNFT